MKRWTDAQWNENLESINAAIKGNSFSEVQRLLAFRCRAIAMEANSGLTPNPDLSHTWGEVAYRVDECAEELEELSG